MARVQQVLDFVTASGCQSAELARHFGEELAKNCGHCTFCRTKAAQMLPPSPELPPLPAGLDTRAFTQLRAAHPNALGHPRQSARFLCGLTSPAITQAKLSRHPLFGSLETRRFREVLAWCTSAP